MSLQLGITELILLFLIFVAMPVANSIVFYRLGKKAGYNQAKAEADKNASIQ
jgi:hypothetical protein